MGDVHVEGSSEKFSFLQHEDGPNQNEINPARQGGSEKTNSMHNEKEDPRNTNSHAGKGRALEMQR
jgi:hypothetical protein